MYLLCSSEGVRIAQFALRIGYRLDVRLIGSISGWNRLLSSPQRPDRLRYPSSSFHEIKQPGSEANPSPVSELSLSLWLYSPLDLGRFFTSYTQSVGLLGRGSARRKAAACTRDNTEYTHTDIHTLGGIRTHDPSVRAGENSSCLRLSGHCDRHNSL
jgi:hypothetical protein